MIFLPQAVMEAANAPTTLEGDRVLRDRGIPVLPDIYTSSGGAGLSDTAPLHTPLFESVISMPPWISGGS